MVEIKIFKVKEEGGIVFFKSKYVFFEKTFDFISREGVFYRITHENGEEKPIIYKEPLKITDKSEIERDAEQLILRQAEEILKEVGRKVTVVLKHPQLGFVRGAGLNSFTNVEYFAGKYLLTPDFYLEITKRGLEIDDINY